MRAHTYTHIAADVVTVRLRKALQHSLLFFQMMKSKAKLVNVWFGLYAHKHWSHNPRWAELAIGPVTLLWFQPQDLEGGHTLCPCQGLIVAQSMSDVYSLKLITAYGLAKLETLTALLTEEIHIFTVSFETTLSVPLHFWIMGPIFLSDVFSHRFCAALSPILNSVLVPCQDREREAQKGNRRHWCWSGCAFDSE